MSSKVPNISRFKIPDYKYIAPLVWGPYNANREIARLRLLQACERLQIDVELWSRIELHALPDHGSTVMKGWTLTLPDFDVMYQSEAEWKRVAQNVFTEECEKFLRRCRDLIDESVSSGGLVPVRRKRDGGKNAPLNLRYEWAASRYLLNKAYKEIGSGKYNEGQVKQAVLEILREAELPVAK